MSYKLFTSESVSEGHPDKLADQISDAVLDECLRQDPNSRVACETFITTGLVVVGGEITTGAYVDLQRIVRGVVRDVGYNSPEVGMDAESMCVMNVIQSQSPDIDQGVSGHGLFPELQGAGDQGMMFGFACNDTPELMPAPIMYSHKLLKEASRLRNTERAPWLRPDAKSQVSMSYSDSGVPVSIDTVVISHQHHPDMSHKDLEQWMIETVIRPVLEPTGLLTPETSFLINPTGRFVIGGPHGDTGLTGRKIIVDTYGGMGRHAGGAFSGKDPSKVDRSAAYIARYIAKNIVAAGLAVKCEVQLSYAIGVPYPTSVAVEAQSEISNEVLSEAVKKVFDLSPAGIISTLNLKRPIYSQTATYGHFGRPNVPWEVTDKIEALHDALR